MTDAERLRDMAAERSAAAESAGFGNRYEQLRRDSEACERAAQVLEDVAEYARLYDLGAHARLDLLDRLIAHGRRMRK